MVAMPSCKIIINLLRDSDRPASHAKLMDDAADYISNLRIALEDLTNAIGKMPADCNAPGWGLVVAAMCGAREVLKVPRPSENWQDDPDTDEI